MSDKADRVERAARDLLRAARRFRDASNILAPTDEEIESRSEARKALERAEYYLQKALDLP